MELTDPISKTTHTEVDIAQPELQSDLVMVTVLPRGSITVEGPESEVAKINRSLLSLSVDASDVTEPGEYRLPIVVDAPDTSNRITVEPRSVRVQIDEVTNKVIPIEVQETSNEDATRVVNTIVPDISQVTISGPSSAVDRVESVILPVTIETQVTSFSEYFTPYAVDVNGQRVSEVTVLPGQVLTRVELQTRGRIVSVIPNFVGDPAVGYSFQRSTAIPNSILVEGPEEELANLLFVNTEPVDITGASQSVSSRVGLVDLPEGVSVVEPVSGQVEVRIAIQDSSATTQTVPNLPVNILNIPDGYSVSVEPDTIDITIQGSATNLANMTSDDVTVVVDVRGLEGGEYTLRPVVAIASTGVMSTSTNPETVTVTLTPTDGTTEPQSITPIPQLHSVLVENKPRRSSAFRWADRTLGR